MDSGSLHASILLVIAGGSLIGMAYAKNWPAQDAQKPFHITEVIPLLLIGVLFSLTLNANGFPLIEWLMPAIAASALMIMTPNRRRRLKICVLYCVLSIGLCLNFMSLITTGFTSAPQRTLSLENARQAPAIKTASRALSEHLNAADTVHATPLARLINRSVPDVISISISRTWHTWLTRLYRIERHPMELWAVPRAPAGEMKVELRPREQ